MAYWFSPNYTTPGETQADCIAQLETDINSCIVTSPNGQKTLDVAAFMALAATREAAIPDPSGPGFAYLQPTVLRSTDVRPYADQLVARLAELATTATGGGTTDTGNDLASLLADCTTKSKAVTDYYTDAFSNQITAFVSGSLTSGALEQNMPDAEDVTLETRYYRTTFVNDWENESAPSDVSAEVNVGPKDTVTVTVGTVPSGRNLSYWRLYRSNAGHEGADWQYVPNSANVLGVPVATATFTDDVKNSALEETCPSLLWDEPPSTLAGVVQMANGIHVGFVGNTLYPTPAYVPWAYPADYKFTVAWPIVATAAWEESLFVGTRGKPYFVTGSDPANLKAGTRMLDSNQACVSQRAVCSTEAGVVYASPDGLCLATPAGVRLLTERHFTREEWQLLDPANMLIEEQDGIIYFIGGGGQAEIPLIWNPADKSSGVVLSNGNLTMATNVGVSTPLSNGVRAVSSMSSGKRYFEIAVSSDYINGENTAAYAGLASSDCVLTAQPIFGSVGGHYGVSRLSGQVGNEGGLQGTGGINLSTNGAHVLGFVYDFTTRALQFYQDGVAKTSVGIGSGYTALYPFASKSTNSSWTMTLRLQASDFTYSIPSGAVAWASS